MLPTRRPGCFQCCSARPHASFSRRRTVVAVVRSVPEPPLKTRLKEIIAKLYRLPTSGRRQVFALSRAEAEQLPNLPSLAIISVIAPDRSPAMLEGVQYLLRLSFADVDFDSPALSERARRKIPNAFRPEHAREIHEFVAQLPETVTSIVVHCEGGFSRSAAIALGLAEIYGYAVSVRDPDSANSSVLRSLREAFPA
jgi:predicted protein tyrosine phosphatase